MRRVLVTGARGMVGSAIVSQARSSGLECFGCARDELDITNAKAVRAAIDSARPDVVFNAAAYTAVDDAENDEETARRINVDGARNVARAAAEVGACTVHVSTDYVFDGTSRLPYKPSDPVNPISVYGRTKLESETAVRDAAARHAVIRTSWVFSDTGRNFVRTMLRLGAERSELRVVNDQRGRPTSAHDLAAALLAVGRSLDEDAELTGTYHFANAGETTWFEFAQAIFDECGGTATSIRPIASADFPTPARRPRYSVLDTASFTDAFHVTPRPWRYALKDTLEGLIERKRA